MVSEPAQNDKHRSADRTESKNQIFGIVLAYFADVGVGKGWLVVVVLRLPVDYYQTEDGECGT